MQPRIGALVEELGLAAFRQASDGDLVFERTSDEAPRRYHQSDEAPPSMRLVGGTTALVQALLRELPPEKILLGTRITELGLAPDGVVLTVRRANAPASQHFAGMVILAAPPRLLEATMAFSPDLDPKSARLWRETPTWMAPTAKFVALYDRPFWREAGLSGAAQSLVGPLAEIHDASTASGQPALFGFFGLAAERRGVHGSERLTRACLAQLARLFGPLAQEPRATLFKNWAADPLTATDRDRVMAGHVVPRDCSWVAPPWSNRLALAGSETSPSEPGYLAGAILAADRAVAEAFKAISLTEQQCS
jgi:monoamine oxidase